MIVTLLLIVGSTAWAACPHQTVYFRDADGDGYGLPLVRWERCTVDGGYPGWATRAFDCDDADPAVHPAHLETCDGRDEDCDGSVDEGPAIGGTLYFPDTDGDGYGAEGRGRPSCAPVAGQVALGGDCADRDPSVHPGAVEVCNGRDDDCVNGVDGADATNVHTWYADADGDGYGDPSVPQTGCSADAGYVARATDCDDTSPDVSPASQEVCDAVDNDCDGTIDGPEAIDPTTWYTDADGDGYGDEAVVACDPPPGTVGAGGDCDDTSTDVSPGAAETCDGVDDDCDGLTDPATSVDATVWYTDEDGDGYGVSASAVLACEGPPGTSATPNDCDDTDALVVDACGPAVTYSIAWGDLHGHTGLSHDGCEDPLNSCLPEGGGLPGQHVFEHAAATGLAFLAITDHAEYDRYQRAADGIDVSIWEEQQAAVLAAEGGPVIPILGYEYTATFGHRTVILDNDEACEGLRKSAVPTSTGGKIELGLETYTARASSAYTSSTEFEAGMQAAAATPECAGTRWLSWFHHPAIRPPVSVDWSLASNHLATDTVVEIASEHGSSECSDLADDGCDFRVDTGRYRPGSSVQSALTRGYTLGFLGGGDNHQGQGSQMAGTTGGYVGELMDTDGDGVGDTPREQFSAGAVTGVYHEGPLNKADIFDAIEARHTLAATWPFTDLTLHAYDDAGNVYLPGDDVPAGNLTMDVRLGDPAVTVWSAELVDPTTGASTPVTAFTLAAGEIRYLRIRASVDGVEQRVWASPFFGI